MTFLLPPGIKGLRVSFGSYFSTFGLITEIYSKNFGIQIECGKIRTRKNFGFQHFPSSVNYETAHKANSLLLVRMKQIFKGKQANYSV